MAPYDYAGEEFLSVELPNYEMDRIMLVVKLVVAFVAWLVVVPVMLASAPPHNAENNQKKESQGSTTTTTVIQEKNGTTMRTKTIKMAETTIKKNKSTKETNE